MSQAKIFSWNVNGVRSALGKGLVDFIQASDPDVLCLQETKCETATAQTLGLPFAHQVWHEAEKKGYSGTAILSKYEPLSVALDFSGDHPAEGRVVTAEFRSCYVVSAYVPNSQRELERLDYRLQWDADFQRYLAKLAQKKPLVVCGDLNVAHAEIDLANPSTNRRNAGFTDEERESFTKLLRQHGFVDTFRAHHPDAQQRYSWWSYRPGIRARNIGWRLDYCLTSEGLKWSLPEIHDQVKGSDHCPVSVRIAAELA
ncbi:MAG: exodeoxyribonuclease III [Verrucomicrobia bacterium]|nr:exodeoxyribonuclease III [Verrucomicrobiota bacterium]